MPVVPVAAGRFVPVVAAPDGEVLVLGCVAIVPGWVVVVLGVVVLGVVVLGVVVPVCANARPPAMAKPAAVAMIVFVCIESPCVM
ncbi:MAG: hypothetical protein H7X75_07420 [Burkholderiaceae bacterium]|nr:hypothetical protein [Burkholderiaceae bacterium]